VNDKPTADGQTTLVLVSLVHNKIISVSQWRLLALRKLELYVKKGFKFLFHQVHLHNFQK